MPETAATSEPVLHKDWTQGPVVKNLLQLAWPMIIMEATYMVSQIMDMVWVGRTGSSSIAALGIAGVIFFMISAFDAAILSGSRAIISRFVGAGDWEGARRAAGQTILIAAAWGACVTIIGSLFVRPIIGIFRVDSQVVTDGMNYLRVLFAGWIGLEVLITGLYSIQASGDSLRPMIIEITIRALHVLMCPFLVLGLWFFPELGIRGAAFSNIISQCLGALIVLWLLFSGRTRMKLSLRDFRFSPEIAGRILKIGFPSFLSMLQSNISSFIVTWVLVPFGTSAIAASSLANNVGNFVLTPNIGLGGGVGVLVGQNLGSKQPERAVKTTWMGAAVLQGFMLFCGVIILIFAEGIVKVFNHDPQLVSIGAAMLRISTAGYLVLGLNTALMNCISGAGDTLPNMLINVAAIWAVQIPLTFVLANHTSLGVYGIRWAMVISTFGASALFFAYFHSRRWQRKKV
jgi:putative MATE family efflux protein